MFDDMTKRMDEILRLVGEELKLIRAGRAKPEMIEHVKVEAYPGQVMQLIELASITSPDPHLLVVQPWDASTIKAIEKGLAASDLKLNPVVDGNIVRISLPALTQERREEVVKLVKQKIESGKNMLRDARHKTKRDVDEKKNESGVSEDDIKAWIEEMQDLFDKYSARLEDMETHKTKDLMEI